MAIAAASTKLSKKVRTLTFAADLRLEYASDFEEVPRHLGKIRTRVGGVDARVQDADGDGRLALGDVLRRRHVDLPHVPAVMIQIGFGS